MVEATTFLNDFARSLEITNTEAQALVEKYAAAAKCDCKWFCSGHRKPGCKH